MDFFQAIKSFILELLDEAFSAEFLFYTPSI